jgi:transposase
MVLMVIGVLPGHNGRIGHHDHTHFIGQIPAGDAVAADRPADDRPGRQPHRRGHLPGGGRRHPPLANTNKLVGYLGLDPRVRQSGDQPAKHGRISKQGSAHGRHALVEAAWSAVRQPGPLRAFYQRVRARRGHQIAIVASARKPACLLWCMLTRREDYAYAQPSLTQKKLRRLELTAGAPKARGTTEIWSTNDAMRHAERALAEQAELAYKRNVADRQATRPTKAGASATQGHASKEPSKG